jgi:methyl-accepting chemotaxis protein
VTEQGLSEITQILMAIAKRDLTQRITRDFAGTFGEMKDYCNETADNLASVIGEIREASETITSGSGEIAKGNADLSSRTEQQAANLEETASSMEEITSTVQLNAENAKRANGLASNASSVATEGGKLIENVVGTMAEIHTSAARIADIIGVIDGIAFQTNILALNAAVEAARAGEQGRGFAVVASEVRTLAQRSANAAKDIKELISDSVDKVESGNKLVNQSGQTMGEIVEAITHVNEIMADIASSSAEQAAGIESINEAIVQMDEMTQQNAALVEEAAAAAESMNTQAKQLGQRVQTFDIGQVRFSAADAPVQSMKKSPPIQESSAVSPPPASAKHVLLPANVENEDEWESF